MNVAILTIPGDVDAHAVAWGLRKRGHSCDLIFFGDLPQSAVMSVNPALPNEVEFESDSFRTNFRQYDRFWLRRPADPILSLGMHPSDRSIARHFWSSTIDSVLQGIGETPAFCINPPAGTELSGRKSFQLSLAHKVGFEIPRTVITSSGDVARRFIRENDGEGRNTIVKGVHHAKWDFADGGLAFIGTTRVGESDISDASLKLAPCIFQAEIKKRSEVRLTVMGRTIFAVNLDSQSIPEAILDFRAAPDWSHLGCEPIEVPEEIKGALFEFQDRAQLNFGTMDFVIDVEGRWIFLETNPMGQFLWVEVVRPEIPLLDAFVEFVISGTDGFAYEGSEGKRLVLSAFRNQPSASRSSMLAELDRHVGVDKGAASDRPLSS